MHPYIFDIRIWDLRIILSSYSLFALLGIITTSLIYLFHVQNLKKKLVAHIIFLGTVMFAAFSGSRISQFIIDLAVKSRQGFTIYQILLQSGATVAGGIVFGSIAIFIYARIDPHRIITWHTIDAFAMAFPFGHMMGRIGCFFAGCCYGKISNNFPLTIVYPDTWIVNQMSSEYILPGPRIPAPLIAALYLLIIGIVLLIIFRSTRSKGQTAACYFLFYGTSRFFQEFLRDDAGRGFVGPLSTGQWFSIIAVIAGAILLFIYMYRWKNGLVSPPFLPINGKEQTDEDAFCQKRSN